MSTQTVGIVGAGPAGCALATYLQRAGLQVTLFDANAVPLGGVGESLIPQSVPQLQDLGVDMSAYPVKRGAVFTRGDVAVRFDFGEALREQASFAWHVRRDRFDAQLREVALAAGAQLVVAKVRRMEPRSESGPSQVHTDDGPHAFDWIVDAAGRNQLLARQLDIRTTHPHLRNAAMAAWHRDVKALPPEEPGDIVISEFDGGWFWFLPLGEGVHSVGAVTTPDGPRGREGFAEALRRCPAAAARLEGAQPLEELRGVSDFTCSASRFHGPGWALLGDAATFLDPVFSTGICLGLNGAQWLAAALTGHSDLDTYETRVRDAVRAFAPVVDAFYTGEFLDLALSDSTWRYEPIRRGVVSLLSGDVFDSEFDAARRIGTRISQLARRQAS
ncbi:MAG: NAD(P)/FAD-dependent oxidoreductase [Myxococcales bacterium]|nr:NAD(P)/FAD-dependent oxidoreductase [Myxococcales bacterium]